MTTESLSVTIEGELLTVEIGTVAAPAGGGGGSAAWGDITGTLSAQTDLNSALGLKAPLASPTLTGTPAAPTAAGGTSTTQIATTAFAAGEITTHAGATDPHGDRAFATSAVSTHAALTTGVHGLGGASQLNVGTTAGTVAAGDDARLSDARTPTAHKTSHATGGTDALTASDIGAATAGHDHTGVYQPLATVLTNTTAAFTTAQETKLSGIEAAADVTDAGNVGTAIDGATAKTTPVDADTVPLIDSAAGNVLKKLSWANIKATAKTYFDTLYQAALVSGTNIKTINSTSLLGSGDIAISASPGGSTTQLQYNNAGAFGGMSGTAWDDTNRAETRTGATVTTSNPVQSFTQTWNAAGVTFTGWKLNVTNTASAAGSMLLDLQYNSVSQASFGRRGTLALDKEGVLATANQDILTLAPGVSFRNYTGLVVAISGVAAYHLSYDKFLVGAPLPIGWTSTYDTQSGAPDLLMYRDAAAVLNLRNSTTAQTLRVSGTHTDSSNYVRAALAATSTAVTLAAETAGIGADDVPVSVVPAGAAGVILGASGAGSANSVQHYNKSVTGIADATATAVLTVTVPNAAHSASIEVILNGSLGAGGAIGANEATGTVIYNVSIARTSGVNAVATISTAYGSSTSAVAGAATITVTGDLGAVSGAVGATNTFTIRATITKGSGASANHTCVATARVLNANATGITIA